MRHRHSLVKFMVMAALLVIGVTTASVVSAASVDDVDASTVTKKRSAVTKLAKKQVGKSYVYGAAGPNSFDCSGLVQYVYKKAGDKVLPRTTYSQVTVGKKVSLNKLKKGDLLFWGSADSPYHVGIYVGGNKYVHAATPDQGVRKQTISTYFYPSAAKRVLE
ncbi:C40 family peptidase [Lactobacillus sp. ESL0684]|uniref:C40 family peptidase n=1 Tax=unclassified Lactobacillus TaxID=2620435 RepID=UPI0023F621D9|nr:MULTISPECIES: C40 family peptidase [unclassified Lactobacillus]WEV39595.1 C40 family peptidase [Lactobacillus sp. ESL0681]WEV43885.1 C40 family peptidase [Lactobacillus sp. ESL0684]